MLYGSSRVCREVERRVVIDPGDTVVIPPDIRHWHGASPDRVMTHLAMSKVAETGEGTGSLEHVTDAEAAA